MPSIWTLPDELISIILENLDKHSLIELAKTSHLFHLLCKPYIYRHAVADMLLVPRNAPLCRPYLHRAAVSLLPNVTETLLAMGAPCQKTDAAGETALHAAVRADCLASVESLLAHGAGARAGAACVVDARNNHGWTPLLLAARYGRVASARELIGAGADVNDAGGFHGWTPLHLARRYGHEDVCQLLLAAGADAGAVDGDGCAIGVMVRFWGAV